MVWHETWQKGKKFDGLIQKGTSFFFLEDIFQTGKWLLHFSHIFHHFNFLSFNCERICVTRELLLKGNSQYNWPPCTNKFRSLCFILSILFTFCTKQVTLMRRLIVLYLPCSNKFKSSGFSINNFNYLLYKTSYLNEEVNCTL